jgi:hypothetical protein
MTDFIDFHLAFVEIKSSFTNVPVYEIDVLADISSKSIYFKKKLLARQNIYLCFDFLHFVQLFNSQNLPTVESEICRPQLSSKRFTLPPTLSIPTL